MPGTLTIRNLTQDSLTLARVEHFEASKPSTSDRVERLASNFTTRLKDVTPGKDDECSKKRTKPLYLPLDEDARAVKTQDLHVTIDPFDSHQTSISTGSPEGKTMPILRLTFKDDHNGLHQTNIPPPYPHSQTLHPLHQETAQTEYTTIYNHTTNHLTLITVPGLSTWMQNLPFYTPLSALSLPGTHNSPTHHPALPSVRCQAVSITTQLENGIRFLDIRLHLSDPLDPDSDALDLVHSAFPIALAGCKHFRDLLEDIYAFLHSHPSETLILCLKREGRGNATDAQLAQRLERHYLDPERWVTKPGIPTLGEARGKVVLMRRYHGAPGWGIDATDWGDNTPHHRGGDVAVQDLYEIPHVDDVGEKVRAVCEHLLRAAAPTPPDGGGRRRRGVLHVNFLSGSNFFKPRCWPEGVAGRVNPAVRGFLCERFFGGEGGTGVVVCDWVGVGGDWDLVKVVVGWNVAVLMKEEEWRAGGDGGRDGRRVGGGRGGGVRRRRGMGSGMNGEEVLGEA